MIIDQQIRDQVLNVCQSFLVQAPAGSGKTTLLVKRFLNLLTVAENGPEEVLAITFTRKAAAEMRERVLNVLEEAKDPIAKQVLARDNLLGWNLLQNPARLKIMTIDSLCSSIAVQMPVVSRFGAQPTIAKNADFLYENAVDQLFQSDNAALIDLLLYLDNDRIKIKDLFVAMLKNRDQWLPLIASSDFLSKIADSLQYIVEETIESVENAVPIEFDYSLLVDNPPAGSTDWLNIADILITDKGEWRKRLTAKQGFLAPSSTKDKQDKEFLQRRKDAATQMIGGLQGCESFRQQLIAVRKLPPEDYSTEQMQMIEALAVVLPFLVAQLTLVFKDVGQVDFVEVSLAALRALSQQPDIALALDCKISHILVDEFQDTSLAQFSLIEQLTINWDDDGSKTLFLVGDPMQSIYRFRQAEVGLFLKAKEQGIGNIRLNFAQLQVNFRSTSTIIEWINNVFRESFPQVDDMTLGAIKYMPSQAVEKSDTCKSVTCIQSSAEGAQVVDIVRNTEADKTIAILVRATSHLLDILPALRAAEIPYQGLDLEPLARRSVVQDLLALTNAIFHLDNRIAWLAVLRAPWLALDLKKLQDIASSDGTIWQAVQQFKIEPFCQIMNDALLLIGRFSIDQLVKRTWQALGGYACLRDIDEVADVDAYFNFLAMYASDRNIYKPDFLAEQLDNIYSQSRVVDKKAVQVMTMHKAKGLEFDVVILPGLGKSTRGNDQKLFLLERRDFEHDYLLVAPIRAAHDEQDKLYDYLAWCENVRQEYEALRLLYVAVTRAKEQLYCLASFNEKPRANSLLASIWPSVEDQFEASEVKAVPPLIAQRTISRLPTAWYVENPYTPKDFKVMNRDIKSWQTDWQRLVGIVVHRAFWHIATYGTESMPDWLQYLRSIGGDPEHFATINTAIDNALTCVHGNKILARDYQESYAEWQLSVPHNEGFSQMIIDRAYLDQDNVFWIIDYKVIYLEDDITSAVTTYTPQLQKYIKAVQSLKPEIKVRAGFYFPLQQNLHLIC